VNVARYVRDIFWDNELGVRLLVPVGAAHGPKIPGTNLYLGDLIGPSSTSFFVLPFLFQVPGLELLRRVFRGIGEDFIIPFVTSTSFTGPVFNATGRRPLTQGNSLRTAAFAVLATLLGYKYGLSEWKPFADRAIEILALAQQGFPPYGKYEVFIQGYGKRRIVDWFGAPHGNWVKNPFGPGFAAAEVSPIRTMLFTPLNVVEDSVNTGGGVTETVPPLAQAFRVYLRYRYNIDYPTSINLP
jgi:hypothetical protein